MLVALFSTHCRYLSTDWLRNAIFRVVQYFLILLQLLVLFHLGGTIIKTVKKTIAIDLNP
jgi:hypothetical protein